MIWAIEPWMWPIELRLTLAAVAGVGFGAVVNWAVSALAYEPRQYSPWLRHAVRDQRSGPLDRVPVVGWWRLRRLENKIGRGFWVRPLWVELLCGLAAVLWYFHEVVAGHSLPTRVSPANISSNMSLQIALHLQYAGHLLLGAFMLAASLIDIDEKNIPDAVTVPGAIVGLTWLTLFPSAMVAAENSALGSPIRPLHAAAPNVWPTMLRAGPFVPSLAIGLACLWFWCGGLMVGGRFALWRWNRRRARRVVRSAAQRIRLDRATPRVLLLGVVGSAATVLVWHLDPMRWQALATSLIGLAVGAAIVWVVRVFGGWAFQKEAMGFGDVTLLAMIGAFLGWQPALLVFFIAPIAALLATLPGYLLGKREMLPYGPYLCAAAALVLVFWRGIWEWAAPRFGVGWLIPGTLIVGFVILAVVLGLMRALRSAGRE